MNLSKKQRAAAKAKAAVKIATTVASAKLDKLPAAAPVVTTGTGSTAESASVSIPVPSAVVAAEFASNAASNAAQIPASAIEQTLEQIRIRYALLVVQEFAKRYAFGSKEFDEYAARCNSMPAQILQNGLHQALMFCQSKAKEVSYQALYRQLGDWLAGRGQYLALQLPQDVCVFPAQQSKELTQILAEHDLDDYLQASNEALALLAHLKRFANAFKHGQPLGAAQQTA